MKTAKEILYQKATDNKDGFLTGQVKWILEAMEEYKNQFTKHERSDNNSGNSGSLHFREHNPTNKEDL